MLPSCFQTLGELACVITSLVSDIKVAQITIKMLSFGTVRLISAIFSLYSVNHSCQLLSKVQWSIIRQSRQLMLNKLFHLSSRRLMPLSNPHIQLFSKSYVSHCPTLLTIPCVLFYVNPTLMNSYSTVKFIFWNDLLTGQSSAYCLPTACRIWFKLLSLAPRALGNVFPHRALCASHTEIATPKNYTALSASHCFSWPGRQHLTPPNLHQHFFCCLCFSI